jgi:hypothetical protein
MRRAKVHVAKNIHAALHRNNWVLLFQQHTPRIKNEPNRRSPEFSHKGLSLYRVEKEIATVDPRVWLDSDGDAVAVLNLDVRRHTVEETQHARFGLVLGYGLGHPSDLWGPEHEYFNPSRRGLVYYRAQIVEHLVRLFKHIKSLAKEQSLQRVDGQTEAAVFRKVVHRHSLQ